MLGLLLSASVHTLALVLYSRYRRTQLLHYFKVCRGQELSEQGFKALMATYKSFLGFAMRSPSRTDYPELYTNAALAAFASRSKNILIYLVVAIIVSYSLAGVVDAFQR